MAFVNAPRGSVGAASDYGSSSVAGTGPLLEPGTWRRRRTGEKSSQRNPSIGKVPEIAIVDRMPIRSAKAPPAVAPAVTHVHSTTRAMAVTRACKRSDTTAWRSVVALAPAMGLIIPVIANAVPNQIAATSGGPATNAAPRYEPPQRS